MRMFPNFKMIPVVIFVSVHIEHKAQDAEGHSYHSNTSLLTNDRPPININDCVKLCETIQSQCNLEQEHLIFVIK